MKPSGKNYALRTDLYDENGDLYKSEFDTIFIMNPHDPKQTKEHMVKTAKDMHRAKWGGSRKFTFYRLTEIKA